MNNAQATKQCLKKNNLIIIRRRDTIRMKMARQEKENVFYGCSLNTVSNDESRDGSSRGIKAFN